MMIGTPKRRGDAQADDPGAGIRGKPVELYPRKAMFTSTHSYRGQEALAVEVCSALQSTDLRRPFVRVTGHEVRN